MSRSKARKEPVAAVAMEATVTEYLRRPYGRVVVPESDGTFRGEIVEFPGCFATGKTAAETFSNLESAAESWLAATIARNLPIPEPISPQEYSGKTVARLGSDLHKRAALAAVAEGVSLNQFIVSSVAERVGMHVAVSRMMHHAIAPNVTNIFVSTGAPFQQWLP